MEAVYRKIVLRDLGKDVIVVQEVLSSSPFVDNFGSEVDVGWPLEYNNIQVDDLCRRSDQN